MHVAWVLNINYVHHQCTATLNASWNLLVRWLSEITVSLADKSTKLCMQLYFNLLNNISLGAHENVKYSRTP